MGDTKSNDSAVKAAAVSAINAASRQMIVALSQDAGDMIEDVGFKKSDSQSPLLYALSQATGSAAKNAPRLAFDINPAPSDNYMGLYRQKRRLLPDDVLKSIRLTDGLVACILRARGNVMSLYGHLRKDRFDVGIELALKPEFYDVLTPEQYDKVTARMKRAESLLLNCGHTAGLETQDKLTLAQFLDIQAQNGCTFGRFACFPEKTKVYTPTGIKNIEDLVSGDLVYSHDGSIQKIKCSMNRPYLGTLYGVHTSGNETVWATDEHPFYGAKDKGQYANGVRFAAKAGKEVKAEWIKASDLSPKDYIHFQNKLDSLSPNREMVKLPENGWILENGKMRSTMLTKNIEFFDKLHEITGYNRHVIQDIFSGCYRPTTAGALKKSFEEIARSNKLSFPEYSTVPSELYLDEELAYYMGAYSGDGSVDGKTERSIRIDLGTDKINAGILKKLTDFYSILELKYDIFPGNGECVCLITYCPPLSKWLSDNIGDRCDNKKIPKCIWEASESVKLNFLAGFTDTDGCIETRTTIGIANEYLAKEIAILAGTVGVHVKVAKIEHDPKIRKDMFVCSFDSKNVHKIPSLKKHETKECQHHVSTDTGVFKRISEIKTRQFSGQVYNIEVENTNSYIVNGISVHNCEIIRDRSVEPDENGDYPFHRFRPVDVGTIYRAVRKGEFVGNNLREIAMRMLESITGDKPNIDIKKLKEDHYSWIQMIDGVPRQAFTHDEMLVFNVYPCTDIELNHYPVSPIDTVVASITTHISIDVYTKLFFQNGRASRGMLVIKSDSIDEGVLNGIKLQFNASVNNVANSFRTPIFGMGTDDEVKWEPFTGEGLNDAQYQNTYDSIARNILAAFNMSPDELPSYGHLAKSTNSQALNESSNEYKLSAARDAGLRPLILKFQTFFNEILFPVIDPLLAKVCEIRFAGLDAQSVEQENTRLQQAMPTYMCMDDVLQEVDKDPIGKYWGGKVLFSERLQLIQDKFKNVGELMGSQLGDNSAFIDPILRYKRDPFFLQQIQLLMQISPNTVKALYAPRSPELVKELLDLEISDMLDSDGEDI